MRARALRGFGPTWSTRASLAWVLVATAGCSGLLGEGEETGDEPAAGEGGAGGTGSSAAASSTATTTTSTGVGVTSSVTTGAGGGGPAEDPVCKRWKDDRATLSEGSWSGSVASCNPGNVSAEGRESALRLVNLYRFLVGLAPVATDPALDQKSQACALMMHANGALSHSPPSSWSCWSSEGAQAAGSSNLATTPGVDAVDLYIADPGNETTMGHRRWILSGWIGPIGLGSTSAYSCMWVIGGKGGPEPAFVAWPPAGKVPHEAMNASWVSTDATGWTIQSSSISLSGASITVTEGGQPRPVQVSSLASGFGSSHAVRFVPQGWKSEPGRTYHVEVAGIAQPFEYDVEMLACP